MIVGDYRGGGLLHDGFQEEFGSAVAGRFVPANQLEAAGGGGGEQGVVAVHDAVVPGVGDSRVGVGKTPVAELHEMVDGAVHAHDVVGKDVGGRLSDPLVDADVGDAAGVELDDGVGFGVLHEDRAVESPGGKALAGFVDGGHLEEDFVAAAVKGLDDPFDQGLVDPFGDVGARGGEQAHDVGVSGAQGACVGVWAVAEILRGDEDFLAHFLRGGEIVVAFVVEDATDRRGAHPAASGDI